MIGFSEPMLGSELQDNTAMELEDITDTLNSLISAGFVETVPYRDQVEMAEVPVTTFEVNAAYAHQLRKAMHH